MNKIYFNKIYVIESLEDSDKKTGTLLHNDIIKRKIEQQNSECASSLNIIKNRSEFDSLFIEIKYEIIFNLVNPYLHFELHGSEDGLILSSGELVSWVELTSKLRDMNIISKNNTFVSLASCYGGYFFNGIDFKKRSPVWGYVGTLEEVSESDVMVGFHEFFEELFNSKSFGRATEKLNSDIDPKIKFRYMNVESMFIHIIDKFFEDENLIRSANNFNQYIPINVDQLPEGVDSMVYLSLLISNKEFLKKQVKENIKGIFIGN